MHMNKKNLDLILIFFFNKLTHDDAFKFHKNETANSY
jgi:hypothetical protein